MNKIFALSALFAASSAMAGSTTLTGVAAQELFHSLPLASQEVSSGRGFELRIRRNETTVCRELTLLEVYSSDVVEDVKYDCTITAK